MKENGDEVRGKDRGLHIDDIIKQCIQAKKDIGGKASALIKMATGQKAGWKKVEKIMRAQKTLRSEKHFPVSKEIHEKFRQICDTQAEKKNKQFSKLVFYNHNEPITDRDMQSPEAFRFYAENKRDFGLPLKGISIGSKNKHRKRMSYDYEISPEDTILQDIYEFNAKHRSVKRVVELPKVKEKTKHIQKESQELNPDLNPRNKIIVAELKKLEPMRHDRNLLNKLSKMIGRSTKIISNNKLI
jgi:hypothetical protein